MPDGNKWDGPFRILSETKGTFVLGGTHKNVTVRNMYIDKADSTLPDNFKSLEGADLIKAIGLK